MIISVDTGNKQIKTVRKTFTAGIVEHDGEPAFGGDVLKYKGKYYTLSEKRIPYMADKTKDERYFILTLFAIGYELEGTLDDIEGDLIDVTLLLGLPPAHYSIYKQNYEKYYKRNEELIEFELNKKSYYINITDVKIYPQAYAAIANDIGTVKKFDRAIIVDIGGFTSDILQIQNGKADLSVCYSEENGTIQFYNLVKNKIAMKYGVKMHERDIDRIINGHETAYSKTIEEDVVLLSKEYIDDFLNTIREYGIDLRSCETIFAGGGSLLFRNILEKSDKIGMRMFLGGLNANAKGYEELYNVARRSR